MEVIMNPHGKCPHCGTVFSYTADDVKHTGGKHVPYLNCPTCGEMISPNERSMDRMAKSRKYEIIWLMVLYAVGFLSGYLFR